MREYDQIKQQTIPEDLLNTINKFNEAKKVILFDEVLPSLDLLNLPSLESYRCVAAVPGCV